jgi:hypothetical protein
LIQDEKIVLTLDNTVIILDDMTGKKADNPKLEESAKRYWFLLSMSGIVQELEKEE